MENINRARKQIFIKTMMLLITISIIILLVSNIYGFEANSSSYSIGSYHHGLSGSIINSSNYNGRTTLTYEQGGALANGSTYSLNIGIYGEETQSNLTIINLIYPSNGQIIAVSGNVTIQAFAIDYDGLSNASLYTNISGIWSIYQTQPASGASEYNNFSLFFENGVHLWNVQYCDVLGSCTFNPQNYTFTQNIQPPGGGGGGAPGMVTEIITDSREFLEGLISAQKDDSRNKRTIKIIIILSLLYTGFFMLLGTKKRKNEEKVRNRILVR